jgi:hypothetical protein
LHGRDVGPLDPALTASDAAHAIEQIGTGYVAMGDSVQLSQDVIADLLGIFRDKNEMTFLGPGSGEEIRELGAEGRRDNDDGAAKAIDCSPKPCYIITLSDDTHIVFQGKDTGGTCPKYGLIVRENETVH